MKKMLPMVRSPAGSSSVEQTRGLDTWGVSKMDSRISNIEAQLDSALSTGNVQGWLDELDQSLSSSLNDPENSLKSRLEALVTAQQAACAVLSRDKADSRADGNENSFVKTNASRLIGMLIRRLFDSSVQAEALAVVSLLTGLATCRPIPTCLSTILSAIISRYEQLFNNPAYGSLLHAIKMALASFMSLPSAEPYYPLLMDALSKAPTSRSLRQKRETVDDDENAESGDESLATGFEQLKRRRKALVDITEVPLEAAIEIIIASFQYGVSDNLREIVERWRPTSEKSVSSGPPAKQSERADPRRRTGTSAASEVGNVPRIDIMGRDRAPINVDQLEQRVRHLLLERLVKRGGNVAIRFNQHCGFPLFIGRLLRTMDCFSLDMFDDLVEVAFPNNSNNHNNDNTKALDYLTSYLNVLYYTSVNGGRDSLQEYSEKLLKLLIASLPENLSSICLVVPSLDYETLVPIIRQHLAPIDSPEAADTDEGSSGDITMESKTAKINPNSATLMMALVGQLREERPNDEWSLLRDLLVECCQSEDALLRSLAVEQGVKYLSIVDARTVLYYEHDESEGEPFGDGRRLDLAMAMCKTFPELITDLLSLYSTNTYFIARHFVLLPMLMHEQCPDLYAQTFSSQSNFWIRLLSLRNATISNSLFQTIIDHFTTHPDPRILSVIFEKASAEVIGSCLSSPARLIAFTNTAINVVDTNESRCSIKQLLEFLVSCAGAEQVFRSVLQLAANEKAIAAAQCCLTLTNLFKPPSLIAAFQWYCNVSNNQVTVLFMRTVLLALTLHRSALTQQLLSLLSRITSSGFPWDDHVVTLILFKQIKLLLPHSLNLFSSLPIKQQRKALSMKGDVELRKPIKDYLYGLPPSVRSRYSQLLQLLE